MRTKATPSTTTTIDGNPGKTQPRLGMGFNPPPRARSNPGVYAYLPGQHLASTTTCLSLTRPLTLTQHSSASMMICVADSVTQHPFVLTQRPPASRRRICPSSTKLQPSILLSCAHQASVIFFFFFLINVRRQPLTLTVSLLVEHPLPSPPSVKQANLTRSRPHRV